MTHLDFVKKLGLTDLVLCLMDEFGYPDDEIADKMKVTQPTIHNAKKRLETISEAIITIPGEVTDLRNKDVQQIVDAFKEAFGTTTTSRYDRFAAKRLADKYGVDNIIKIIQILASNTGEKYAPTVNSVRQIEEKWVNIANYFNRLKEQQVIEL